MRSPYITKGYQRSNMENCRHRPCYLARGYRIAGFLTGAQSNQSRIPGRRQEKSPVEEPVKPDILFFCNLLPVRHLRAASAGMGMHMTVSRIAGSFGVF